MIQAPPLGTPITLAYIVLVLFLFVCLFVWFVTFVVFLFFFLLIRPRAIQLYPDILDTFWDGKTNSLQKWQVVIENLLENP